MPKAMGKAEWTARAEAYQEAADHLEQSWTDDPTEREQGNLVRGKLLAECAKCHRIAETAG